MNVQELHGLVEDIFSICTDAASIYAMSCTEEGTSLRQNILRSIYC